MSQVSSSTNTVKATWIAGRPQWYLASIGLTNRVQPYCMLATQAMQMTPMMSCAQGFTSAAAVGEVESVFVFIASLSLVYHIYLDFFLSAMKKFHLIEKRRSRNACDAR